MPNDKFCSEHGSIKLLVEQHEKRIDDLETMTLDISTDVGNIEGRVTTFIWVIGLTFFLLCSVAFYGVIQINVFKDVYIKDSFEQKQSISKLSTSVELTNYKMATISKDIDKIEANPLITIDFETKQAILLQVEDVLRKIDKERK